VIRSICPWIGKAAAKNRGGNRKCRRIMSKSPPQDVARQGWENTSMSPRLFVTESFHGIEACSPIGRQKCKDTADQKRTDTDDGDIPWDHFRRKLRETDKSASGKPRCAGLGQPSAKLISIPHQQHSKPESHQSSKQNRQ
jgi:hypothetical protein